jgi:hypothetical protein
MKKFTKENILKKTNGNSVYYFAICALLCAALLFLGAFFIVTDKVNLSAAADEGAVKTARDTASSGNSIAVPYWDVHMIYDYNGDDSMSCFQYTGEEIDLLSYIVYDSTNIDVTGITRNGSPYSGATTAYSTYKQGNYEITFTLNNVTDTWADGSAVNDYTLSIDVAKMDMYVTGWIGSDETAFATLKKHYDTKFYAYKYTDTNDVRVTGTLLNGVTYRTWVYVPAEWEESVQLVGCTTNTDADLYIEFTFRSSEGSNGDYPATVNPNGNVIAVPYLNPNMDYYMYLGSRLGTLEYKGEEIDLLSYVTYDSDNIVVNDNDPRAPGFKTSKYGGYGITFTLKNLDDVWEINSEYDEYLRYSRDFTITIDVNAMNVIVIGWNGSDENATAILDEYHDPKFYAYKITDTNDVEISGDLVDGTTYRKWIYVPAEYEESVIVGCSKSGIGEYVEFTYSSTKDSSTNNTAGGDTSNTPDGGNTSGDNTPSNSGETPNDSSNVGNGNTSGSGAGNTNNTSGSGASNTNNTSGSDTGNTNSTGGNGTGNTGTANETGAGNTNSTGENGTGNTADVGGTQDLTKAEDSFPTWQVVAIVAGALLAITFFALAAKARSNTKKIEKELNDKTKKN